MDENRDFFGARRHRHTDHRTRHSGIRDADEGNLAIPVEGCADLIDNGLGGALRPENMRLALSLGDTGIVVPGALPFTIASGPIQSSRLPSWHSLDFDQVLGHAVTSLRSRGLPGRPRPLTAPLPPLRRRREEFVWPGGPLPSSARRERQLATAPAERPPRPLASIGETGSTPLARAISSPSISLAYHVPTLSRRWATS